MAKKSRCDIEVALEICKILDCSEPLSYFQLEKMTGVGSNRIRRIITIMAVVDPVIKHAIKTHGVGPTRKAPQFVDRPWQWKASRQ